MKVVNITYEWLLEEDKKLDVVDSFCYLGDTIGAAI